MRIEKNWGYEEIIYNGDYCCKLLVYTKSIASSLHYHERKHETFTVLDGMFLVLVSGESRIMFPRECLVLPPNTEHRVRCLAPGTIVESSTHDDPADCIRLIPSDA
jgi:mannose-6-phosphate isomerase-like protein (cupin superfamily)